MMYSEFLELSGSSESYISFAEYTNSIEPIYTNCSCKTKKEFIRAFKKCFQTIVYPAIEMAIDNAPLKVAESYLACNDVYGLQDKLETIDREARQIGYKYLELITR